MSPQSHELAEDHYHGLESTKTDERNQTQTMEATEISYLRRREHLESLLTVDVKQHHGNADKLLAISIGLQSLGMAQKAEIRELQAKTTIVETKKMCPNCSRHGTEDSKSSTSKSIGDDPEETALVFSLLDNRVTVRQVRGMKEADYIKADLPPFQWWSDRLHIYFEKGISSDPSSYGRPQVIVQSKLGENATRDATFIHTIKLGQLGFGIRIRRFFGQIRTLYVLYPRPHSLRSPEMTKYDRNGTTVPSEKVASPPLSVGAL